jgi:hypothetical protein
VAVFVDGETGASLEGGVVDIAWELAGLGGHLGRRPRASPSPAKAPGSGARAVPIRHHRLVSSRPSCPGRRSNSRIDSGVPASARRAAPHGLRRRPEPSARPNRGSPVEPRSRVRMDRDSRARPGNVAGVRLLIDGPTRFAVQLCLREGAGPTPLHEPVVLLVPWPWRQLGGSSSAPASPQPPASAGKRVLSARGVASVLQRAAFGRRLEGRERSAATAALHRLGHTQVRTIVM